MISEALLSLPSLPLPLTLLAFSHDDVFVVSWTFQMHYCLRAFATCHYSTSFYGLVLISSRSLYSNVKFLGYLLWLRYLKLHPLSPHNSYPHTLLFFPFQQLSLSNTAYVLLVFLIIVCFPIKRLGSIRAASFARFSHCRIPKILAGTWKAYNYTQYFSPVYGNKCLVRG